MCWALCSLLSGGFELFETMICLSIFCTSDMYLLCDVLRIAVNIQIKIIQNIFVKRTF